MHFGQTVRKICHDKFMHWIRHMKRSASEQSRSKVAPKLKFLARLGRKKGGTVPNT